MVMGEAITALVNWVSTCTVVTFVIVAFVILVIMGVIIIREIIDALGEE